MALPMGLCPEGKRGANFCFFKKKHDPTMLDKQGPAVYSTSNGCPINVVDQRVSKLQAYFPQSGSFHSRPKLNLSSDVFLVGGFLGSKSQVRSEKLEYRHQQNIWDFVWGMLPGLFGAAAECLNYELDSVLSSPKKKKQVSTSNKAIAENVLNFSVLEDMSSLDITINGPKQSYAEVASKPGKPDIFRRFIDPESARIKRTNRNSCKSQLADHRSNRRRLNRRDKREGNLSQTSGSDSSLTVPQPDCKDLRLNQQEKHFRHLRVGSCITVKKQDRHSNFQSSSDKKDQHQVEQSQQSHSRYKQRPHNRSHCDNKRGVRARNFNCDIDKINWRTGEPIFVNMASQLLEEFQTEDYPADQTFCDSFIKDQRNDDSTGELRLHEISSCDVTSWPETDTTSPKCRQLSLSSECSVDSDDFIIFQSETQSDDSLSDTESDYSDCDSESYESDSASSDEVDALDGLDFSSKRLLKVNELWQKEYSAKTSSSPVDNSEVMQCMDGDKKVRFSSCKPVVHNMLAWDFAYRSSRPGPWEQMARDRVRFKSRIRQIEGIISPVLTAAHRKKVLARLNQQL